MSMIDIHAHLCLDDFDDDRDKIVERCRKEGLSAVIVSSARLDEGICALELCKKNEGFLYPTLGYHPTDGEGEWKNVIDLIRKNKDKIVGIGEVGLDYHWEKDGSERKKQKEVFSEFIELSKELDLPLVLHTWDAERECFDMVRDAGCKKVLFHCYTGKNSLAKEITDAGYYVSVSTAMLFSKHVKKVARDVPFDQFTLETDAPFLSPNKEHDKRNYPWNIMITAKKMAGIRDTEESRILSQAEKNARDFFNI